MKVKKFRKNQLKAKGFSIAVQEYFEVPNKEYSSNTCCDPEIREEVERTTREFASLFNAHQKDPDDNDALMKLARFVADNPDAQADLRLFDQLTNTHSQEDENV